MIPDDLKYSKEHEWVKLEGDIAIVGITDYAQGELGDIVFVELPNVGTKVEYMQPFGTIEAVKAVSDLFSPVTGEVTEVNKLLEVVGKNGGYIASPAHAIPGDAKPENIAAMIEVLQNQ